MIKKSTHNSPQIRLRTFQLRADVLQHELLHVTLDFRVLHNLPAQGSGHVERTKPLLRWTMGAQNGVDEPKDREEGCLGTISGKGKQERRRSRHRGGECLILV